MRALFNYVNAAITGPVLWILAFSGNKANVLDNLQFSSADVICFTEFQPVASMPWVKVAPRSILKSRLGQRCPGSYICDSESLHQALLLASSIRGELTIVIAGSLYLVSEFFYMNDSK